MRLCVWALLLGALLMVVPLRQMLENLFNRELPDYMNGEAAEEEQRLAPRMNACGRELTGIVYSLMTQVVQQSGLLERDFKASALRSATLPTGSPSQHAYQAAERTSEAHQPLPFQLSARLAIMPFVCARLRRLHQGALPRLANLYLLMRRLFGQP